MRRVFLFLAILDLAVVGWGVWDELVTRRPWKQVQAQFNDVLAKRGEKPEPVAIREVTNPALGLNDRCQTCHLGAARDGFGADVPPAFRTHPRRAELLDPHPPDRFGCTTCHQGQGPQTKGVAGRRFDHGRDDPYWERPLLAGALVQASCLDCHEGVPKGAEVLARGRELFESLNCTGCHQAKHLAPQRKATLAPSLGHLREKTSQAFVEEWLKNPAALRPGTRMPSFWPVPLDANEPSPAGRPVAEGSPAYAKWKAERDADTEAIAAYFASMKPPAFFPVCGLEGDINDPKVVEEGRALFDKVGCRACHVLSKDEKFDGLPPPGEAHFGPSLENVGEKATAKWLASWIKNPRGVWADARMPDLRLADADITRLVAFLVTQRRPNQPPAKADWAPNPALVDAGKAAITRLGCVGCHEIPGIQKAGSTGPELESFGEKTDEELTFGDASLDCGGRSKLACFAVGKVQHPRRFEGQAIAQLAMPEYDLAPADLDALAVFLLAQRARTVPTEYRRELKDFEKVRLEGQRALAANNCSGCHALEAENRVNEHGEPVRTLLGGWVRRFYDEPALAPPSLDEVGRKLQPTWLWAFLQRPYTVRPFLAAKMPDFKLSDAETDAIARWFAQRDGEPYPISHGAPPKLAPERVAEAQKLFEAMQCRQCHPAAGATVQAGQAMADLAPDLALAPTRLKPQWIKAFLTDPQKTSPGTRMPTFFAPLDEEKPSELSAIGGYFGEDAHAQIDALTAVVAGGLQQQVANPVVQVKATKR